VDDEWGVLTLDEGERGIIEMSRKLVYPGCHAYIARKLETKEPTHEQREKRKARVQNVIPLRVPGRTVEFYAQRSVCPGCHFGEKR
jgi:hypothetical protein